MARASWAARRLLQLGRSPVAERLKRREPGASLDSAGTFRHAQAGQGTHRREPVSPDRSSSAARLSRLPGSPPATTGRSWSAPRCGRRRGVHESGTTRSAERQRLVRLLGRQIMVSGAPDVPGSLGPLAPQLERVLAGRSRRTTRHAGSGGPEGESGSWSFIVDWHQEQVAASTARSSAAASAVR